MAEREFPFCDDYKCFACKGNQCMILTEALDPCAFFKLKKDVNESIVKAYKRLTDLGHNVHKEFPVLWNQYKQIN